ncbi:hypothetical protein ElP_34090 [Tautonia plasticadhaerens]|uniref:Transposase IS701-like DDE domain-containing protein n=1 Tax=Tautonia plasticadhaerens TaxID=2527974 RepID=A0A518H3R8_9BACT|nr:hypothetical protein ElP_34090 [Tautonia plasticadhaerens]
MGVSIAYATCHEHALVDVRLYLPKGWAKDRARPKRRGIPGGERYRTRRGLAPEMLEEAGPPLPHGWVAGDNEMGRSSRSRAGLRRREERYLLAVPSNTTVRDLEAEPPERGGRGRPPKRAFEQARAWAGSRPPGSWRRIEVGDGERGQNVVELVATRVVARTDRGRIGPEELLAVLRGRDEAGATKQDYDLSDPPPETLPADLPPPMILLAKCQAGTAAVISRTKAHVLVASRGASASQSTTRKMSIAAAVARCWRCVFARPA